MINVKAKENIPSIGDSNKSNGSNSIGLVRSPRRQLPLTDISFNNKSKIHAMEGLKSRRKDYFTDTLTSHMSKTDKRLSQGSAASKSKRKAENRIGPWRLGRTLGRGSTGRVRLAKHCQTGQLAAIKIIPKVVAQGSHGMTRVDENGLPYGIEREIIIMKLISHPNIMALYDVWENNNDLYLVLEYIEGGELFDFLVHKGRLTEHEAAHYFGQIIDAVAYCHKFQICHRDLKPENILLDSNHNIKLADFGMAALETRQKLLETSCGSPHYAAPEIVSGKSYHGSPSDVWSCGVILFAMLTGHLPFDDTNIRNLLLKVQTGKYRLPSYLSIDAKNLIRRMLRVNPEDRIPIEKISHHPFILKYGEYYTHNAKSLLARQLDNLDVSEPILEPQHDILHNLQTLWHGVAKDKIMEKLRSPLHNSEKMFYYLLLKYKETHSTNNNGRANFDHTGSGSSDTSSGSDDNSRLELSEGPRPKKQSEKQYQHTATPKKQTYRRQNRKHDVTFPVGFSSKHRLSSKHNFLTHSASIVTTTIQDKNGKVIQQRTKKVLVSSQTPNLKRKQIDQIENNKTNFVNPSQIQAITTPKLTNISRYSSLVPTDSLSEFKYLFGPIYNDPNLADQSAGTSLKGKTFNIFQDNKKSSRTRKSFKTGSPVTKKHEEETTPVVESGLESSPIKNATASSRISQQASELSSLADLTEEFVDPTHDSKDNYVSVLDPGNHKVSGKKPIQCVKPLGRNNYAAAKFALKELGIKGERFHLKFNQGKEDYGKSLQRKSSLARSIRSNSIRNLSMLLDDDTSISTMTDDHSKAHAESPYRLTLPKISESRKKSALANKRNSVRSSRTNNTNARSSFEYSFLDDVTSTVHNAIEIPIVNSSEDHLVKVKDFGLGIISSGNKKRNDKFEDAQEDAGERNFLNDENSIGCPLKVHQRVDSNTSEKCANEYPNIRCSLMNGSNYEFVPDGDKRLSLTPEKAKMPKVGQDFRPKGNKRESIFADPEESNTAICPAINSKNSTIFDEEDEMSQKRLDETENHTQVKDPVNTETENEPQSSISSRNGKKRYSVGFNGARMPWLSSATEKASTLLHKQAEISIVDISLTDRHKETTKLASEKQMKLKETMKPHTIQGTIETETRRRKPNWFHRIFGSMRGKERRNGEEKGAENLHNITTLHRKNTVKLNNFFGGVTKQFYVEADYLIPEEAESALIESCSTKPEINVKKLSEDKDALLLLIVEQENNRKLSIKIKIEKQIGGEYGFGGCFIHMSRVNGSALKFRRYCKLASEEIKRLDAKKMKSTSASH